VPEADETNRERNYHLGVAAPVIPAVKGASSLGWGMQHRLNRIFRPESRRTVMLAVDHGYFQGPTSGLERPDITIRPLVISADALMVTRGLLRSAFTPAMRSAIVLRASGGPSVLGDLSDEHVAMDIEDALRLDASAVAVQVYIGSENESRTVRNMTRLVDAGYRCDVPVLGVTAVGRELVRDARYLGLATRICAELGAQLVKTYYCEKEFENVTAGCPVPVVMAGGRKIAERDALTMAYRAISEGAAGVDMGRNIFQSDHPAAMLAAVNAIVHDDASADDGYAIYQHKASGDVVAARSAL
jgi:3-hydroxy-5-phosphonooxypentane-2,4-dione thiolase